MLIKEIYLHRSNFAIALITNRWENSLKREVSQALSTDILARIGPVIIHSRSICLESSSYY